MMLITFFILSVGRSLQGCKRLVSGQMHFSPTVAKLQLIICCVVAHFLDRLHRLLGVVIAVTVPGGQDFLYHVVVLLNLVFNCWDGLQILDMRKYLFFLLWEALMSLLLRVHCPLKVLLEMCAKLGWICWFFHQD